MTFKLSATKLKRFLGCPRSYFLKYVQGAPEDVRGNYLVVGNAFDAAVQAYCSGGERGVRSIDPKVVRMLDSARRHLPAPGVADVQTEWRLPSPCGTFLVEAKPDLVVKLGDGTWIVSDTKTTAASKPGEGSAMTAEQLHQDVQARLYAWCAHENGARNVRAEWLYTSKATRPESWKVEAWWNYADLDRWMRDVVAPAAARMQELEAQTDADAVMANLDACDRCWVRAHCDPYAGPNTFDAAGLDVAIPAASLKRTRPTLSASQGSGERMAFDIRKLKEESVDLVGALEASLAAGSPRAADIAINPPSPTHAALEEAIAQCRAAADRAERLLAQIRGGL